MTCKSRQIRATCDECGAVDEREAGPQGPPPEEAGADQGCPSEAREPRAEEARRKRTRQQIVIGAELQRMASAGLRVRFNGPVESILATVIIKIVLAGLTRPQDRALFGLPPLAEGANPVAVMAEADEELSALLLEIRPGAGLAGA